MALLIVERILGFASVADTNLVFVGAAIVGLNLGNASICLLALCLGVKGSGNLSL